MLDASAFEAPSTKQAAELLSAWGQATPTLVVATEDEAPLIKSFRNLERVLVTVPSELEVAVRRVGALAPRHRGGAAAGGRGGAAACPRKRRWGRGPGKPDGFPER